MEMKTKAQLEAMSTEELNAEVFVATNDYNLQDGISHGITEAICALVKAQKMNADMESILVQEREKAREKAFALYDYLDMVDDILRERNRIKTLKISLTYWKDSDEHHREWIEENVAAIEAPHFQVVTESGERYFVTTEEGSEGLKSALNFVENVRVYHLPDDITVEDAITTLCPFDWFDEELTRRANDFDFDGMEV